MSIAEELNRIQNAKSALKEAINAKGGTLGTETLEHYAQAVYRLKTEGTAVISSPDFFKCAAVKGATSYKAAQITWGDEGTFPITRSPDLDYPYSYTTPDHLPGASSDATAYGYTYTMEGGEVVQCAMDSPDPKDGDYIYPHGADIRGDDWKLQGDGSIGVYATAYIPPEWSGNKAVLTDGLYTFEEAVTEGLTFGNGFTPEVGKIYNGDATVRVDKLYMVSKGALPVAGYIYGYEKGLDLQNCTMETTRSESLTTDSSGSFVFGNGSYIDFNEFAMLGDTPRTFIFQASFTGGNISFLDGGGQSTYEWLDLTWTPNALGYHTWPINNSNWASLSAGTYIIAYVYDGNYLAAYVDGEKVAELNITLNTGNQVPYRIGQYVIGDWQYTGEWRSNFCAVYDRALTQAEIEDLTLYAQHIS